MEEKTKTHTRVMTDPVNHPKHYNSHPSGIECIEVIRHENFNIGNAIKYIWRRNHKGNPVEDLKKAVFYINDEIKRLESQEGEQQCLNLKVT